MALIPPLFLDAVVALGIPGNNAQTSWSATGFFYGKFIEKDDKGIGKYVIYLVTNRHVVQNQSSLIMRLNPQGPEPARDCPLQIVDRNNQPMWTAHPDPSIDVSVTELSAAFITSQKIRYAFFEEDNHVVFLDQIRGGFLNEGDPVYVLGYPMGLVAPDRQYVISRFGSISRIRDLKEGYAKDFLVDATVFPGNSGGPVINGHYVSSIIGTQAPNKACLIGMVKSYIPYHDRAVSPQTGQTRVVFEENSGLSSVVPTDFIKETVDLCHKNTRAAIVLNQSKKVL